MQAEIIRPGHRRTALVYFDRNGRELAYRVKFTIEGEPGAYWPNVLQADLFGVDCRPPTIEDAVVFMSAENSNAFDDAVQRRVEWELQPCR